MKTYLLNIALIVLVVVIIQGHSLSAGLLLDDNNHRAELREGDWSFRSLVGASHLGDPRRRVRMWWQDEADLFFFRPLSFALMRAEYVVGGWRPSVMHVFSLAWAVACASLVMVLGRAAGLRASWVLLAGVLFALHPGNAMTVRWLACQNQQMVMFFVLAALWFYGRWSRWQWRGNRTDSGGGSPFYLMGALLCAVAAMGCRESGVVLVPLLVVGDYVARPARMRGRWPVYILLGFVLMAYFVLRHAAIGPFSMPVRPYAYPPSSPGFLRFVVDKFFYYVLSLVVQIPIVGFAGLRFLRSQPMLFYGGFAFVVAVWAALLRWLRPRRIIWLFLAMATLPLMPVLPVFASSHHLYSASAGVVLAGVMLGQMFWDRLAGRVDRAARWGRGLVVGLIILHVVGYTAANAMHGIGLDGFSAASRLPVEEVVQLAGPLKPGDRLFFINLPPLGFNCMPAIEEARGVSPLRGYVLTFASSLMRMNQPSNIERVGTHGLRVRQDGDGYFSGLQGRSMLEAIGRSNPFEVGSRFVTDDFSVEVIRADERGIQEFLFTFNRPLSDPTYHFFFGSPGFSAYPVIFNVMPDHDPGYPETDTSS